MFFSTKWRTDGETNSSPPNCRDLFDRHQDSKTDLKALTNQSINQINKIQGQIVTNNILTFLCSSRHMHSFSWSSCLNSPLLLLFLFPINQGQVPGRGKPETHSQLPGALLWRFPTSAPPQSPKAQRSGTVPLAPLPRPRPGDKQPQCQDPSPESGGRQRDAASKSSRDLTWSMYCRTRFLRRSRFIPLPCPPAGGTG